MMTVSEAPIQHDYYNGLILTPFLNQEYRRTTLRVNR
jgi:hypothetical protein